MANKNLTELSQIDAAIKNVRVKGLALRNDCHDILVAIMDHYAGKGNGDYSRLNTLMLAVNETIGSSTSAAMVQWVYDAVPSLVYDEKMTQEKGNTTRLIAKFRVDKSVKDRGIRDVKNFVYGKSDPSNSGKRSVFTGNMRDLEFYWLEREVTQKPFTVDVMVKQIINLAKRASDARDAAIMAGQTPSITASQIEELKRLSGAIKGFKDEPSAIEERKAELLAAKAAAEGHVPPTSDNKEEPEGETTGTTDETPVGAKVPEETQEEIAA